MIRSFDEYKRIYDKIECKEGLENSFILWVTVSWIEDRFPSIKKHANNAKYFQLKQKYYEQEIRNKLFDVYKRDPELAKVLIVGFTILDIFAKECLEELAGLYHR